MFSTLQAQQINSVQFESQMSPELRRMDMINRARREELDVMVYGVSPRQPRKARHAVRHQANSVVRFLSGMRNGIGNALIAAGTRIHSAA